jgi:hypothetical protein
MQLFDDLDDFGSFDDAVAGDVRDPYTELSRIRKSEPVQRLDFSVMPGAGLHGVSPRGYSGDVARQ